MQRQQAVHFPLPPSLLSPKVGLLSFFCARAAAGCPAAPRRGIIILDLCSMAFGKFIDRLIFCRPLIVALKMKPLGQRRQRLPAIHGPVCNFVRKFFHREFFPHTLTLPSVCVCACVLLSDDDDDEGTEESQEALYGDVSLSLLLDSEQHQVLYYVFLFYCFSTMRLPLV